LFLPKMSDVARNHAPSCRWLRPRFSRRIAAFSNRQINGRRVAALVVKPKSDEKKELASVFRLIV
jgi:hypothetical protein